MDVAQSVVRAPVAVNCCPKGGKLSIPGVSTDGMDDTPMDPLMNETLSVNTRQTHVRGFFESPLETIEDGQIDPSEIITHTGSFEDDPEPYETFNEKDDNRVTVVLEPQRDGDVRLSDRFCLESVTLE